MIVFIFISRIFKFFLLSCHQVPYYTSDGDEKSLDTPVMMIKQGYDWKLLAAALSTL